MVDCGFPGLRALQAIVQFVGNSLLLSIRYQVVIESLSPDVETMGGGDDTGNH